MEIAKCDVQRHIDHVCRIAGEMSPKLYSLTEAIYPYDEACEEIPSGIRRQTQLICCSIPCIECPEIIGCCPCCDGSLQHHVRAPRLSTSESSVKANPKVIEQ